MDYSRIWWQSDYTELDGKLFISFRRIWTCWVRLWQPGAEWIRKMERQKCEKWRCSQETTQQKCRKFMLKRADTAARVETCRLDVPGTNINCLLVFLLFTRAACSNWTVNRNLLRCNDTKCKQISTEKYKPSAKEHTHTNVANVL